MTCIMSYCVLASSQHPLPAPTNPKNARIRSGDPLAKIPKANVKRGERRTVAQKRKFRSVQGLLGGLNCWPGKMPSWLYISCKASWKENLKKIIQEINAAKKQKPSTMSFFCHIPSCLLSFSSQFREDLAPKIFSELIPTCIFVAAHWLFLSVKIIIQKPK